MDDFDSDPGPATRLIHAASPAPQKFDGLSTPVFRASTVLAEDMASFRSHDPLDESRYVYGTVGTPTTLELARRLAQIEGAFNAVLAPSGLSAITLCLLSFLRPGDHVLVPHNVYQPMRRFCERLLMQIGVSTTYYDPMQGEAIAALFQPTTRLLWLESPGSITFEVCDVPALSRVAHERGALVAMDNTWSAGWFFKPFDHGVDLSIQALTKYQAGHGDLVMGAVLARNEALWRTVRLRSLDLGLCVGPDEAWYTLRGLSTLSLRLKHVESVALSLAQWLSQLPQVARVLHPALPSCPGHALWQRDFTGSSGVFSFLLQPQFSDQAACRFVESLRWFKLGASWGGPVSLALAYQVHRSVGWLAQQSGAVIRLNIGFEAAEDLQADLQAAFAQLR